MYVVFFLLPFALALDVVVFVWYAGDAAQIFFLVLGGTAQGRKVVSIAWPHGPFAHRFWNASYLLLLLVLSVLPVVPLLMLDLPSGPGLPAPVLLISVSLWLFLPVILLSVASSTSTLAVCRWSVFCGMCRRGLTVLAFYVLSAPLVIGGVSMVYLALVGWQELVDAATTSAWLWLPSTVTIWSWTVLLPGAAAFITAALLIYARLVGRVGWLLDWDADEAPEHDPIPTPASFPIEGEYSARGEVEIVAETAGHAEEVYQFRDEPMPNAGPALVSVDPVRLLGVPPKVPELLPPLPSLPPPRGTPRTERPRLLVRGIYEFPWYRSSLKTWILLTCVSLVLLLLIRIQLLVVI